MSKANGDRQSLPIRAIADTSKDIKSEQTGERSKEWAHLNDSSVSAIALSPLKTKVSSTEKAENKPSASAWPGQSAFAKTSDKIRNTVTKWKEKKKRPKRSKKPKTALGEGNQPTRIKDQKPVAVE